MSPQGPEGWASSIRRNVGVVAGIAWAKLKQLTEPRVPSSVLAALKAYNLHRIEPLTWADIEADMLSRVQLGQYIEGTKSPGEQVAQVKEDDSVPVPLRSVVVFVRQEGADSIGADAVDMKRVLIMLDMNFRWLTERMPPTERVNLAAYLRAKSDRQKRASGSETNQ